jgi:hypothetical protein
MQAHLCPNCGAPLAIGAPGSSDPCPRCHTETARAPDPGRSGRILGVIGMCLGVGAAVFVLVQRFVRVQPTRSRPIVTVALAPTPVTLKELPTADLGRGWHPLDGPAKLGPDEAFDVVANVAWARGIAVAWRPDALLVHLHASTVTRNGTMDLSAPRRPGDTTWAAYWFSSPGTPASAATLPASVAGLEVEIETMAEQNGGKSAPRVRVATWTGPIAPELPVPTCSLSLALTAAAKAGWLSADPAFDVDLKDTRWGVRSIAGAQPILGVVNVTTCAAGAQ